MHGYVEGPTHQSVHVIVDAYLKRGDHNILVLDWSELADGNFLVDAVPNLKQVCGWHTSVNLLCESTDMYIVYQLMNVKSIFMHDARTAWTENGRSNIEFGGRRLGH